MTNLSAQTIQHQVRGMPTKKQNFLTKKAEIAQGYTATSNSRHLTMDYTHSKLPTGEETIFF